ncbi:MAG: NAD(P)-dependent oxidoreductase, partial [Candidatus Parcubacteria bacterium]|nr:NAD(P)-dependent oxidoreductase [Candidatus Parcubacteria bacterium]
MKIAFFGLEKADQDYFLKSFEGVESVFFEGHLDKDIIGQIKDIEILCIFIDSEINKDVIDMLPNLKFIATRATGFNNIDIEYAKSKDIKVSNVPAYGANTVAEFTFGLILNLSRKLSKANNYIRETFDFNFFPMMEGFDLAGKTLGVIGTGRIGKNVVKIAKGFGMNVIAYDLFPDLAFAKENSFIYKSLSEVLASSDIVTLHAPYTKENHHMINKENISIMKKGIYLVNTARGE